MVSVNRIYSLRVNQLDSQSLDTELASLFETHLRNIDIKLLDKCNPEVEAVIKWYLWWHTVRQNGQTVGQMLLNLRYFDVSDGTLANRELSKRQTLGIASIQILLPWLRRRSQSWLKSKLLSDAIELGETLFTTAEFVNSLLFLYWGKYRSLGERLLRLQCGIDSTGGSQPNQVYYEFMNRELLWHAFAEFLAFILPLINFYRLRNWVKNVCKSYLFPVNAIEVTNINERVLSDLKCCGICNKWPLNAYEFGCRHVFCYYCLMSNAMLDELNFKCPVCLYQINDMRDIKKVRLTIF